MNYKYKYKKHKTVTIHKKNPLIQQGISKEEVSLLNTIKLDFPKLKVYESDRMILHGREIDIWIPSKMVGIEFDGLYFHNSDTKDISYHLHKTIECEKQGIQLIHVFSDEWENRKPQVLDTIRKVLGKYQLIEAEDCELKLITKSEGKVFLDNCDIFMNPKEATDYIGLFYNNNLVSVLAYKESKDCVEILRYTDRISIKVNNGLSKLISNFNKPIIYYLDRRYYTGYELKKCGFLPKESTMPNTWYTKDYKTKTLCKYGKINEKYENDPNYKKVYDCGSILYEKKGT